MFFNSMYKQYERVIFQSLITSFGLDLFIKDRLGGDVDTINNVRKGEEGGGYKSAANAAAYENRGGYEYDAYHDRNNTFQKTKHDARYAYNETKNP